MYSYSQERGKLFTEDGQEMVMKAWANAQRLLKAAGAFMIFRALDGVNYGDTFVAMAILDRLVELKYLHEITSPDVAGQDRVFIRGSGG